jgi:CheY-like chemotaxis protein
MKTDIAEPLGASANLSVTCRVLVVDDYEDNRHMLRILLQRKGITVFEAKNGCEALEVACQQHPDGILMDLSMPVMDGFEATRRLKEIEVTKGIPVVALSAHCDDSEQRDKALEAGCLFCLKKPFQMDMLDRFLKAI